MWTQAGLPPVDGLGPHEPGVRDVLDTRRCDGVQGPVRLLPACLKGAGDCQSRLRTGVTLGDDLASQHERHRADLLHPHHTWPGR